MHPATRHSQGPARRWSSASPPASSFASLPGRCVGCFTRPSDEIFGKLVVARVIGPSRHPITRLSSIAEPDGRRAHDADHRFLRLGAWSLERLWRTLASLVVEALGPPGQLELAIDDTIFRRWRRKVEGAARDRDPVRSITRKASGTLLSSGRNGEHTGRSGC